MSKRYLVTLTESERAALRQRLTAGRGRAHELVHAQILLKADCGLNGPGWIDGAIAAALDVRVSTVQWVRERFAAAGSEAAVRARRPG